jgi:hypothetical protein
MIMEVFDPGNMLAKPNMLKYAPTRDIANADINVVIKENIQ